MSSKSNILLKILIVVALILAGLVYYSNKIIHEKPIPKESVEVKKSVVMPHPPLSDKHEPREEIVEEKPLEESTESEVYFENEEPETTSIELTPNIPMAEVEIIADDSLIEPEIIINEETEVIENPVVEELPPIVKPPVVRREEREVVHTAPQAPPVPRRHPNNNLGTRIGGDEEKKQNIDLGVQLF